MRPCMRDHVQKVSTMFSRSWVQTTKVKVTDNIRRRERRKLAHIGLVHVCFQRPRIETEQNIVDFWPQSSSLMLTGGLWPREATTVVVLE